MSMAWLARCMANILRWSILAYDVVFHAPVFKKDGTLETEGSMTVFFNGVLVQDNSKIWGATAHAAKATYSAHEAKLPIGLQDHGDPLCFRNVWLRPLAN
jgi:hypothetical protein